MPVRQVDGSGEGALNSPQQNSEKEKLNRSESAVSLYLVFTFLISFCVVASSHECLPKPFISLICKWLHLILADVSADLNMLFDTS